MLFGVFVWNEEDDNDFVSVHPQQHIQIGDEDENTRPHVFCDVAVQACSDKQHHSQTHNDTEDGETDEFRLVEVGG